MSAWFRKKEPGGDPGQKAPFPGSRPADALRVASLLTEETVLLAAPGRDKHALLKELVWRLAERRGIPDPAGLLAKVLEREQGISTTLDSGLSLPHARIEGLSEIVAGLALIPGGIPDPVQSDLKIRVMFLFFSPNRQEAFPRHLQLLRAVAALLRPPLIDELAAAGSSAKALDLLRSREA